MLARYYTSVAELKSTMGSKNSEAKTTVRLRGLIAEASRHLEMDTLRRFDRRVETFSYVARHVSEKGSLLSARELSLKHDCQSVTAVSNLGTAIDLSELSLSGDAGSPFLSSLSWTSDWQSGDADGKDVYVTGTWGYGGAFLKLAYTLAADATEGALTLNLTGATGLEYGMLLRIDDEYLVIDDTTELLTASAVHVERGANGTTAAAHSTVASLYVFVADYVVQRVTKRLARWMSALDDNPLYTSAIVGDVQIPFNPSAWPQDIKSDIALLEKRLNYIGAPR